jgi:hypothetical protein
MVIIGSSHFLVLRAWFGFMFGAEFRVRCSRFVASNERTKRDEHRTKHDEHRTEHEHEHEQRSENSEL